jgi:S1-C subfamily serine protease
VKAKLRIVSGARAGFTEVFSASTIDVGRHPSAALRLDPDRDLEVSATHATILRKGDRWYVRDAESRNGTFVNGHRITGDTALDDTDHIRLGAGGPVLEIRLVPDATPDGVVRDADVPTTARAVPGRVRATSSSRQPEESTTQRVRAEVGRQTRTLRLVIVILFVSLLVVGGSLSYRNWRESVRRDAEYAALQARTDSVLNSAHAAMQSLQGEVDGLATRLRSSRAQIGALQESLATAYQSGRNEDVTRLSGELEVAMQSLRRQQAAATVDFRSISEQNQSAVALVWVEFRPGEVYTGTAFAVRRDGHLVTNRHVVAGERGTIRPRRIAVRFADSRQTFPGRLVATSDDADLAVIKVDIPGGVPTVRALSQRPDTLAQGEPVAIIGFPLGVDLPMRNDVARTTLLAGTVSKVVTDVLQIDGYGAAGASGSPIFDRGGTVVGVLFGGDADAGGRIVYGVPSSAVIRLLRTLD